jgi:hypothetical protein
MQGRVRAGNSSVACGDEVRVRLARANRRHCEALVRGLGDGCVSERDIGALYLGYRRADRAGRARLVAQRRISPSRRCT